LHTIIFDKRWSGTHGIGRFAHEVRIRLDHSVSDLTGSDPVTVKGFLELEVFSAIERAKQRTIFMSPGYVPPINWHGPVVFTIHDLIHVDVSEERSNFKSLYYKHVILPGIHKAARVFTDSEYSRDRILEWSGAEASKVVIVSCGVSKDFSPEGDIYSPGYPYIFYVRNAKPHKNTLGLIRAFALLKDQDIRLLLSGKAELDLQHEALRLGVFGRVIFTGRILEKDLPAYYRGASVVTMPSFYEGFGLPPLEGMASGVPVVVANATSLPEVVGDAGLLVDPASLESIADGLERALHDTILRETMIARGLERAQLFTWDMVGNRVRSELAQLM
jgi:glycosyltransferase involved in cell wall biosynthesis